MIEMPGIDTDFTNTPKCPSRTNPNDMVSTNLFQK